MVSTPGTNITAEIDPDVLVHEQYLAVSICVSVLLLGILTTACMRVYQVTFFAETAALLVIGMVAGAIVKNTKNGLVSRGVVNLIDFDTNLFFLVLLPPIIFNSGLEVKQEFFKRNIWTILNLAFMGTFFSTIVVAFIMYTLGRAGWIYGTDKLESLVFGSLISATDPVTVLAVFQSLKVRPDLLSLVFGESVLNDAVALVLYETLINHQMNNRSSLLGFIFHGVFDFILVFTGSTFIGIGVGMVSALIHKHFVPLQTKDLRVLEASVVLFFPYLSYTIAAGTNLSGIVSILFCGMTMTRYTRHNLSKKGKYLLYNFFHAMAYIAEAFIFIYLGMAIFTADEAWSEGWPYGVAGMFACLVGRFVCVVPICMISNFCRSRSRRIKRSEMFALWYSGLRGGIAFALSTKASKDLSNRFTGEVFEAATILIVCLTVIICGSSMNWITKALDLIDKGDSSNDDATGIELSSIRQNDYDNSSREGVSTPKFSFAALDERVLKPFLIRRVPETEDDPNHFRDANPTIVAPTVNEPETRFPEDQSDSEDSLNTSFTSIQLNEDMPSSGKEIVHT